jgi:predicted nucleic acid-binding protein
MKSGSANSAYEFVDTNILIYAHDPSDAVKQARALRVVAELVTRGELVVSTQVLHEFYAAATRPHKPPSLSHQRAREVIEDLTTAATVLPLTASTTLLALDAVQRLHLSFWDALIWAAAKASGIVVIHTEDQPGATIIDGVEYRNPLVDAA